jgi:hypothetical protein
MMDRAIPGKGQLTPEENVMNKPWKRPAVMLNAAA